MSEMIHSTREKWYIAYGWTRTMDGTMVPDKWNTLEDVLRDLRIEYPRNAWSIFGMIVKARDLRSRRDWLRKKYLDSLDRGHREWDTGRQKGVSGGS